MESYKHFTITIIGKKHDFDCGYDYRAMMIAFSCKYTTSIQFNYMFFHASLHKYTPADTNTGNMYLFHVILAKATIIVVITCDC